MRDGFVWSSQVPVLPSGVSSPPVVVAQAAGAIENGSEHAFADFRKDAGDIQIAFYLGLEVLHFFLGVGILQIVKRAAIRERGSECRELQRSDLNSFAEAGHSGNAAETREAASGNAPGCSSGKIVSGQFAKSEQASVLRNGVKTHAAAEFFEERVVRMRQRFGQIHVFAAADLQHSVVGDDVFFERGDGNRGLDGGARNVAVAEGDLLIHDGQNSAGIWIDGDDGTIVTAQRFDSGLADDGIVVMWDRRR